MGCRFLISDFWCGNVREAVQRFLLDDVELPEALKRVTQSSLNIVATFDEQEKMFPLQPEISQWKAFYKEFKNSKSGGMWHLLLSMCF